MPSAAVASAVAAISAPACLLWRKRLLAQSRVCARCELSVTVHCLARRRRARPQNHFNSSMRRKVDMVFNGDPQW
jgi:hypothetical protein